MTLEQALDVHRLRDHWLKSNRSTGNGRSAGLSSVSHKFAYALSCFRKRRWFSLHRQAADGHPHKGEQAGASMTT